MCAAAGVKDLFNLICLDLALSEESRTREMQDHGFKAAGLPMDSVRINLLMS